MNRLLIALALLALIAAPALAQDLTLDALQPDAALLAQSGSGATIDGASWHVVTVEGYRGWFDLIDPRDNWGVGISADLSPGGAACVGAGYREGPVFYYGLHF